MDADGSLEVDYAEFVAWFRRDVATNGSSMTNTELRALWNTVDADGSGTLDFWEVGTVVMLCQSQCVLACDACGHLLVSPQLYVCLDCWAKYLLMNESGRATNDHLLVAFCDGCRPAGAAPCGHILQYVPNDGFTAKRFDDWSCVARAKARCDCCHEEHSLVPAYLDRNRGRHVQYDPSHQATLCEWCTTAFCSRCGESMINQSPAMGLWSREMVHTTKCRKQKEGNWCITDEGLSKLASAGVRPHCATCRPRMLQGTMWRASPPSASPRDRTRFADIAENLAAGVTLGAAVANCAIM